jgi:flagellar biosynthesis/type III secretory pathway ATPase
VATAIAEYFRDQGKQVLLMVDSVTRVAMAWREIGLAVGEPPTTKGYPPSVFAMLPRLLERAGNGERGGITGIYTGARRRRRLQRAGGRRGALDPRRATWCSRASSPPPGHFPAIDVLDSKSRVRDQIVRRSKTAANLLLQLEAAYREKEDLIIVGAYQRGSDPMVDAAMQLREQALSFLQQRPTSTRAIR